MSTVTTVVSPHDDIQRSLLAIHLAQPSDVLVDFNLPCGGLEVLLDLAPDKNWADLQPLTHELTPELLERVAVKRQDGPSLLAAPARVADLSPELAAILVAQSRACFPNVIVDLGPAAPSVWQACLSQSDQIALVVRGDLPGLVTGQRCLGWLRQSGWSDRVRVVLASPPPPEVVSPTEVAAALGTVFATLPWDPETTSMARNLGQPNRLPRSPLREALAETVARWGELAAPITMPSRSRWRQTGELLRDMVNRMTPRTT